MTANGHETTVLDPKQAYDNTRPDDCFQQRASRTLPDVGEQLLIDHQITHTVSVILFEAIALTPLPQRIGIDLHDSGTNTPRNLQR